MICPRCGDYILENEQFCKKCKCLISDFTPERQQILRDKLIREIAKDELLASVFSFVMAGVQCLIGMIMLLIHISLLGPYTFADLISKSYFQLSVPLPIPVPFPSVYYFFFHMLLLVILGVYCTKKRRALLAEPSPQILSVYGAKDLVIRSVILILSCMSFNLLSVYVVFLALNPYQSVHGWNWSRNSMSSGKKPRYYRRVVQVNGAEIYFDDGIHAPFWKNKKR